MRRYAIFAVMAAVLAAPAAHAQLTGATVSETYYTPDLSSPYADATYAPQTFVVGSGPESIVRIEGVTFTDVDFSDSELALAFSTTLTEPVWNTNAFNGLVFTSDAFTSFSGVTIGGASNFSGFDASRVTLAGNELRLNWNGLGYNDDTQLDLSFISTAVPEPSAWAMMLIGFGVVGFSMRRRRNKGGPGAGGRKSAA